MEIVVVGEKGVVTEISDEQVEKICAEIELENEENKKDGKSK